MRAGLGELIAGTGRAEGECAFAKISDVTGVNMNAPEFAYVCVLASALCFSGCASTQEARQAASSWDGTARDVGSHAQVSVTAEARATLAKRATWARAHPQSPYLHNVRAGTVALGMPLSAVLAIYPSCRTKAFTRKTHVVQCSYPQSALVGVGTFITFNRAGRVVEVGGPRSAPSDTALRRVVSQ